MGFARVALAIAHLRPAEGPPRGRSVGAAGARVRTTRGASAWAARPSRSTPSATSQSPNGAIRKGIGGTAAQIRTRLNYLIERNKVTYKGRASGTRYKAK